MKRFDSATELTAINLYVSERRSLTEVARMLRIHYSSVKNILERYNIARRKQTRYNTPRLCADCDNKAEFGKLRCNQHVALRRKLLTAQNARNYWRKNNDRNSTAQHG